MSALQVAALVVVLVPSVQSSQVRSCVVEGGPVTSSSAWQTVHGSQRSALSSVEKLFSAQGVQPRAPVATGVAETYWPGRHAPVPVQLPAPSRDQVPGAQGWHAVVPLEALPARHGVQVESVVALPAVYPWPAGQAVRLQLAHEAAFSVVEYLSAPQAAQVRFVVEVGALVTDCPEAQSVQRVQVPAPWAEK